MEGAALKPRETVLVNGATGSAGRIAVQLAKYLGVGKVIATGRNEVELQKLLSCGADVVIPFSLGMLHPSGVKDYEQASKDLFADGIHVVIDYLWGENARTAINLFPSRRRVGGCTHGLLYAHLRFLLRRFDPAVTGHANVDGLLRTEPQVQPTNPPMLNNHSNDFKSHCTIPL